MYGHLCQLHSWHGFNSYEYCIMITKDKITSVKKRIIKDNDLVDNFISYIYKIKKPPKRTISAIVKMRDKFLSMKILIGGPNHHNKLASIKNLNPLDIVDPNKKVPIGRPIKPERIVNTLNGMGVSPANKTNNNPY